MHRPGRESNLTDFFSFNWKFCHIEKASSFALPKELCQESLQKQNFMPCSYHEWISISCNLNSKGYIRIVRISVFIRKNPGEQMILVPRKLLLLHVCDCNRLRTKIDGLSAHQVPLRLWKSRAWITYFTFWKTTGTNIKQNQQKNQPILCAMFSACCSLIFWMYIAMLQCTCA